MNRRSVPVPRTEVTEVVTCTKNIDAAIVSILARLENHDVAEDVARDLSTIAANSLYARHQMEWALEKDAKGSVADAEVPS